MTTQIRLVVALTALAVSQAACFDYHGPVLERRTERTYDVAPGSLVRVAISGGPVTIETGPEGRVQLTLIEEIHAQSDRDADDILKNVDVSIGQQRGEVQLLAQRRRTSDWRFWNGSVRFTATLTVPPDVRLDLKTSGGRIRVRGERTASIEADTSGGSITVDGGTSTMTLDTSGGSIRVGSALAALDADTSGGGITVDYVGPDAKTVTLDTSGGGIRVGIDRDAKLGINATTSGGNVEVDGLPFESQTRERSHLTAALNGGGGQLRATTSGGGIRLSSAATPDRVELNSDWD